MPLVLQGLLTTVTSRRLPAQQVLDVAVTAAAVSVDELFFLGTKHVHTVRFAGGALPWWAGGGVVLVAGGLLLLRRRFPLRVFTAVWVVACAALLFREWLFLACLAVALYAVASTAARPVAVAALAVCAPPMIVQASLTSPDSLDPVGEMLVRLGFFVLVLGVVWGLGRHHHGLTERERLAEERHVRQSARALEQERLRLGRELHDIVSHTVSVMTLQAAGARTLVGRDDQRVVGSLEVIEQAGVQAMNELGRLLTVIRREDGHEQDGDEQDALSVQPRLEDLPELVELARAAGQDVELDLSGDPGQLDPSVALACYRVVQESLTNARKHAGRQALVRINLTWVPPRLVVTVSNDAGFAPSDGSVPQPPVLSTGHGLRGLQERIQLVGGELESGPTSNGGFLIRATLPVASVGLLHPEERPLRPTPGVWSSFD